MKDLCISKTIINCTDKNLIQTKHWKHWVGRESWSEKKNGSELAPGAYSKWPWPPQPYLPTLTFYVPVITSTLTHTLETWPYVLLHMTNWVRQKNTSHICSQLHYSDRSLLHVVCKTKDLQYLRNCLTETPQLPSSPYMACHPTLILKHDALEIHHKSQPTAWTEIRLIEA